MAAAMAERDQLSARISDCRKTRLGDQRDVVSVVEEAHIALDGRVVRMFIQLMELQFADMAL